MNSMEEKLWDYIDGGGTPAERTEMERLLATDVQLKQQYEELLQLNAEFKTIELDEPAMAFTYNVMESIRMEEAAKPLKASVNKRIILGIAGFFVLTIAALILLTLFQVDWKSGSNADLKLPVNVNLSAYKSALSGPVMKAFWFFDIVAGLFLADMMLRRRRNQAEKEA